MNIEDQAVYKVTNIGLGLLALSVIWILPGRGP